MAEAVATERRIIRVPPVVAFGSKFGKYKPEEEKEVRKVEVKEDKVLTQLKAAWRKLEAHKAIDFVYKDALKLVEGIGYSAEDVGRFSLALAEFDDKNPYWGYLSHKAGVFLSALINNGKDSRYVIHTGHLNLRINDLGFRNTKDITVNGDLGSNVGYGMRGGSITVNGNAGINVGLGMEAGTIIVNGNTGPEVGRKMEGGEIRIEGEYEAFDPLAGGRVYHKGNLIVDK